MLNPQALSLVLLAITLALAYGIWYAYGVLLVALLGEFGWSRSVLAGAFSVFAIVHGIANPFFGVLCDRLPPPRLMAVGGVALCLSLIGTSFIETAWQLYLGFGVCTAISVAACGWTPAVVMVQQRYPERLGFALGIVSSGIGVGMLLVVPTFQFLIEAFGWRVADRALAVACLLWIVPSAMYLMRQARRAAATDTAAKPTASIQPGASMKLGVALRRAPFWLMVGAFFFGAVCSQTMHVHQVAFLVDHGIAPLIAASVVGVVGASSIVGKTGGGWLSDHIEREVVYVIGVVIMIASVAVLFSAATSASTIGMYVYAVMLGIGYSATASIIPAMVSDRFSGPNFGAIIGIGMFAAAIGAALGPWLGGHLFDKTGSYALAFVIAAACGVLAGAAGWIARMLKRSVRAQARD